MSVQNLNIGTVAEVVSPTTPIIKECCEGTVIPLPREVQKIILRLAFSTLTNITHRSQGFEKKNNAIEMFDIYTELKTGSSILNDKAIVDNTYNIKAQLLFRLGNDFFNSSCKADYPYFSTKLRVALFGGDYQDDLDQLLKTLINDILYINPSINSLTCYGVQDNLCISVKFANEVNLYKVASFCVECVEANKFEAIVRAGANLNILRGAEGRTLLHTAVLSPYRSTLSVTRLLGAGLDPILRDDHGKIALDYLHDSSSEDAAIRKCLTEPIGRG